MNDIIDPFDQAIFVGERATKITDVAQCIWIYNSGIDADGLRQFHANLCSGRLARLIERSPLPFGRHRWVSSDCHTEIEFVPDARDRAEFDEWLAEQAHSPIDAEHGPGWHLAVLRFNDGGTGISLVTTHCVIDGVGLIEALSAAARGSSDAQPLRPRGARRRWRAVYEDAMHAAGELPAVGRATLATIRRVRSTADRTTSAAHPVSIPPPGVDRRIVMSTAVVFVDARIWDARAELLGGTSNTLLAGLAVRLAQRIGRVAPDGSVELTMPVSERTVDDTRGNAVTHLNFTVNPTDVSQGLHELRTTIKHALRQRETTPDERRALLPIIPLLPQWLFRRIVGVTAASPIGVNFSNLGTIPTHATRPDGTPADRFAATASYPGMTENTAHRIGGRLQLHSGRANERVFLTVLAYEPGRPNSNETLQQKLWACLEDFSLEFHPGWQ